MKRYSFHTSTTESHRNAVVLALRRDGYVAYAEEGVLVTNASVLGVALACGTSTVLQ